jgi:twitching motility protein PilT
MNSPSEQPQSAAVSQEAASGAPPAAKVISTASIVATMLQVSKQVSDLIFSPGRAPQVELDGQLKEVNIAGVGKLMPDMTRRIAADLIGKNDLVAGKLDKEGSTDLSYSLPGLARFRVNIFRQRGSYAIVMRVIPQAVPDFNSLNLPVQLGEIAGLRNGIVLVTGPTGSGKSSTLAAILNKINEEEVHDSSTRAAQRHADFRFGTAGGPAPGSQGDPGR